MGQVRNTKFGINVSNKMLLNAAKCQVTAFTVSDLLRENQITPPPKSQIRVKKESFSINILLRDFTITLPLNKIREGNSFDGKISISKIALFLGALHSLLVI